jgi:hypothetical protein
MTTPTTRTPVRIARGTFANLSGSLGDLQQGEITYATDVKLFYVVESGALVAQGYATTGQLNTLSGQVNTISGNLVNYATLSGATFTGNVAVRPSTISGTALFVSGASTENIVALGTGTAINCTSGNYFTATASGATVTYTVTGVPSGQAYGFAMELLYSSGSITWFSGVEWPASTAPTLTTGKTHLVMFITDDGGTRWRGSSLVNYTT